MKNLNCICTTAMAHHRCRHYDEGANDCDRPPETELFSHIKNQSTMQVNKNTIEDLDADQLSDAVTAKSAIVTVEDIETSLSLIQKFIEALSGRKALKRRVEALENIVVEQQRAIELLNAVRGKNKEGRELIKEVAESFLKDWEEMLPNEVMNSFKKALNLL